MRQVGKLPDLFVKGPRFTLEDALAAALRERHDADVLSWTQVAQALGLPRPELPNRFPWEGR